MITLPQIKQAIIDKLKAAPDVVALLVDVEGNTHPEEIREAEWQGTKFRYPNIRVRIERAKPINGECTQLDCTAVCYVFGEKASSLTVDELSSQIMVLFHGKSFQSALGVKFNAVQCEVVGADRLEEPGVWLGLVRLTFRVN